MSQVAASESTTLIKSKTLSPGDTIALVMPASPCKREKIDLVIENLIEKGFNLRLPPIYDKKHRYLAGTDEERASALMDCWLDPEVKAIWCLRGGYGSTRILPLLDFEAIRANPKIFIGMSDITALHVALTQNADQLTFLGPGALAICADEDLYGEEILWSMLFGIFSEDTFYPYPDTFNSMTISPGICSGELVGGNLAIICSLIGTPWELKTDGKILLLEDVGEKLYRIDRMLLQIKQAGLLDQISGLILASFSKCGEDETLLTELIQENFRGAPYPVLYGFPSGHIDTQAILPLNCRVELDIDNKSLKLLDSPLEP